MFTNKIVLRFFMVWPYCWSVRGDISEDRIQKTVCIKLNTKGGKTHSVFSILSSVSYLFKWSGRFENIFKVGIDEGFVKNVNLPF